MLGAAWLVARKDLAIEWRTRTAFFSATVFALLGLTIFYFAWDATAVAAIDLAPGVLWVIFTFSGLLGLQRSFGIEQADRAMDALLSAPVDRESIYLGKALANILFVAGVQCVALPAVALFYNVPMGDVALPLAGLALLAAIGIVAVGTLFSAMVIRTRFAELLLPVLLLPFMIPPLIWAVLTTAKLFEGRPLSEVAGWLRLLAAYDIVFTVLATTLFPVTVNE